MQCFGFKTVSKILIVTKCDWDLQSKEQLVLSFWNIGEQANCLFYKTFQTNWTDKDALLYQFHILLATNFLNRKIKVANEG